MRYVSLVALYCASTFSTGLAQDAAPKMETAKEKASYQVGFQIGTNMKRQGVDIDPKLLAEGVAAALAGKKSAITPEEAAKAFEELDAEMQKKVAEKGEKNMAAGQKFLEENKTKEGVKVTKSGLQYKVIKEGTGAVPKKTGKFTAHYKGSLIDGTVFDSSYQGEAPTEEDQPLSLGVGQVIAGWTEALQLMKVGAKYRLFIPSELAYGPEAPASIGPNSVLVFDIELIDTVDESPLKDE